MSLEIRFSPEAKKDFEEIKAYIANDNPMAAVDMIMYIRVYHGARDIRY